MPGSLPGIIIKLSADTKDAIQGLNRVKGALGETATTGDKMSAVMPKLGVALAAAGAAAGAMAMKFAVDGVNAFMADEAAATSLATTLKNLGLAHDTTAVEEFIDAMQRSTGVADDQLRPAFDRLIRSTRDVGEAQRLLSLAMDISAGTGKSLEAVTAALGRAADGSTTALSRLGIGLSASELKAMSFEQVTAKLGRTFEGQAAAKAGTFQGSLNRLNVAWGELQESFGRGFIEGLTKSMGDAKNGTDKLTTALKNLEPAAERAGGALAELVTAAGQIVSLGSGLQSTVSNLWVNLYKSGPAGQAAATALYMLYDAASSALNPLGKVVSWLNQLTGGTEDAADSAKAATPDVTDLANGYGLLADNVRDAYAAQVEADQELPVGSIMATSSRQRPRNRRDSGGGSKAAIERLLVNWRSVAKGINDEIDGLALNMTGKSEVISGALVDSFNSRKDAFKTIVAEQVDTIKQARDALDSYAQTVGDTILGKINFATEAKDAEGKTVPMTPEQIVTAILGDINNQQSAVNAMAGIVTKLPEALAQKLLALPPDAQIGLANYLSDPANAALLETLNTNFTNLATTTETMLGIPMANAFTKVGGKSATAMIDEAMATIRKQAGAFKDWVQDKLGTTITVKVNYDTSGFGGADGNPATPMATGGIVTRPTFAMIGEAGPEAVIPLSRGASYGVGGGSTYNINVNAGVGDPAAIGRTVVESIRAYERRSGKVFAAA